MYLIDKRNVLDHGYVEIVDMLGNDHRVLETARISTGAAPVKGDEKDKGLIRYLYKNEHLTPFEQVVLTFKIKAPIFVFRQWMRHRSWSYNEYSGRYSEMIQDGYIPKTFHKQSDTNHQGSGEDYEKSESDAIRGDFADTFFQLNGTYENFINDGMAKEQARMILPVSQYSMMFGTVNLRNLFHFLELRLDAHAQYEIRVYAEAIMEMLENIDSLKWSVGVFKEFNALNQAYRKAINLSGKDTSKLLSELQSFSK